MARRVVQFSTGHVGRHSLRALIERPDLELVGVHAASADKVGRDAAELCGLPGATGIIATDDVDALVALNADCVVYTTQAETRPEQALQDLCKFLAAGTNAVGTSFCWLVVPKFADEWLLTPLRDACREGNSSLYINGIDPGFSGDTLVLAALSLTERVERVVVQEIFDYGTYDDPGFTGVMFGFGATPDVTPHMFAGGALTSVWGGLLRQIAEVLGVTLEDVREYWEPWLAVEAIDCTMMRGEPGTIAAVRFGVEGIVDGKPMIVMEHINRLTESAAPNWPYPPDARDGVHRVVVEGYPGVEINAHVGLNGIDCNEGGIVATAMRAVNAIEAVCESRPGLLGVVDLPGTYSKAADDERPTTLVR